MARHSLHVKRVDLHIRCDFVFRVIRSRLDWYIHVGQGKIHVHVDCERINGNNEY